MGLFDKFKDTAKAVAGTATEKILSMKEESDKKAAEKNAEVEAIQKLSSIGSVSSFMDRPTVAGYYDFCIDMENQQFVMRKVSDKKPFKKFSFKSFSAFRHLNTSTLKSDDYSGYSHELHLDFMSLPLEMTLYCRKAVKKTDLTESVERSGKRKTAELLYTVVSRVDDNGTKSWVNEVCEFYDLLPFFDENGDVIDDNKKENSRLVCEDKE